MDFILVKHWVNKFDLKLSNPYIKMILRNGKMIGTDQVIIDFDYASKMWRKNKIKYGEGQFRYI